MKQKGPLYLRRLQYKCCCVHHDSERGRSSRPEEFSTLQEVIRTSITIQHFSNGAIYFSVYVNIEGEQESTPDEIIRTTNMLSSVMANGVVLCVLSLQKFMLVHFENKFRNFCRIEIFRFSSSEGVIEWRAEKSVYCQIFT